MTGPCAPSPPPGDPPAAVLLDAVLETVSDGVVVIDATGTVLTANAAGEAMLAPGVRSVAIDTWAPGRTVYRQDGVTPLPADQGPAAQALRGVRSTRVQMIIRDGCQTEEVRLVVSARPLPAAAGMGTRAALVVFHDVTAATRLQEQVVAEHDRFGHLLRALSSLGEGVIIVEDRHIVFVNEAYAALTGYSTAELVTRSPDAVAGDEDTLADFARWRDQLQAHPGVVAVMVSLVRHRDGHLIPVETVGIEVETRGVRQRISVNRDLRVSDRNRAELADRAAVLRTANRDLAVARDAAHAASRAKSAFLTTVSHEIRTPLNAVVGLTELVLGTGLTGEQREHLETVHDSADDLVALVDAILDWSTIESGGLQLEHRPFGLRELIASTVAAVAPDVDSRDVELLVEYDPGCPEVVVGDAGRFGQILANLVGNAVKFTDRGRIVVRARVAAVPGDDGRQTVEVSVADTGIGIGAAELDGLFRDFAQVDSSSTRAYGGTGLGLAISRRLAEHMGGSITVTSEPAVGSVFTVRAELGTTGPGEVLAPATSPGVLPGTRVLVVGEDPVNRLVLTTQLTGWGMHPRVVPSGAQALAELAAGRLDLAVFDLRVPGGDGRALLDELARSPGGADLAVVVLGPVSSRTRVMAAAHPPDQHLTGPVRPAQLRDTLAAALGQASARRAAATAMFPAAPVSPAAPAAPVSPAPDGGGDVAPDMRVLVVEDNPVNRKVAELMLTRLGCAADIAVNGREAVEAVHRVTYDVILMDLQMPVLDGIGAAAELRREPPAGPRPWIIALTASVLAEDRENCAAAGMDDYLNKPLHSADLAAALHRVPEATR